MSNDMDSNMFYVIYGKIVDDKQNGVHLAGVHFGGITDRYNEAEAVAHDCVNCVKGGTIIPRIFPVPGPHRLLSVMQDATKKFKKLEGQMVQAEDIINRNSNRRKQ